MFNLRLLILIALDLIGVVMSYGFIILFAGFNHSYLFLGLSISIILSFNHVSGLYKQLWRFTSFREVQGIFSSYLISFCSMLILNTSQIISIQTLHLFNFFSFFLLYSLGIRGVRRYYVTLKNQTKNRSSEKLCVLVIGAGNSGSTLIKHIQTDKKDIHICGILDNDIKKIGTQIHRIPVLGPIDQLLFVISKHEVQQVLIAMPSAPKKQINELTQQLIAKNISFKVVPHIRDMIDSHRPVPLNAIRLEHLIEDKEFQNFNVNINSNSKKKILITGGSGYIGTHLTQMFLNTGYEVILLDNHIYGSHGITHLNEHPDLTIIEGDIANIKDVVRSIQGVDVIIALAAIVGDPACSVNPQETLNLNFESSKILVEAANFYGIKKLVFASSCSVYGVGGDELLTEESPLNPVSLYAKTRIMSENIIFERCESVSPVILRLSTVFGYSPRMRFDLVVNLLTAKAIVEKNFQIFGGSQWRPFIHCKDVAQAFYLAATADQSITDRQVFNIGSSQLNYQLKDIGTLIKTFIPDTNYEILKGNIDERNYKVSFEKIKNQLNFNPEYTLESGIEEMIDKITNSVELQNYKNAIYSNVETIKNIEGEKT